MTFFLNTFQKIFFRETHSPASLTFPSGDSPGKSAVYHKNFPPTGQGHSTHISCCCHSCECVPHTHSYFPSRIRNICHSNRFHQSLYLSLKSNAKSILIIRRSEKGRRRCFRLDIP